jgi:hypothetical protein
MRIDCDQPQRVLSELGVLSDKAFGQHGSERRRDARQATNMNVTLHLSA